MAGAKGQGPPSVRPFLGLIEAAREGRCARAPVLLGRSSDGQPALALRVSACSRRARDSAKLPRADRDPEAGPDGILSPGASRRWPRLGPEHMLKICLLTKLHSHSVYLQLPPLISAAKESFSVYSLAPFLLQSFLNPLQSGVGPHLLH